VDLRNVIQQFIPGLAGGLWSSSSAVVDQSMAAALPMGSVAALNYGWSISSAVLGVVAQALAIAVLPSFSRLVAVRQWGAVRGFLRTYTWLSLGLGLAATVMLTAFARPLIALLFERGAFTPSDTATVANIQIAFAVQLPAYLASTVMVRLLAALKRNWVRTVGGLGNLILNIVLNYYLMQRFGIIGIALSTSFVCILSSTYLAFMVRRELASAEAEAMNLEPIPTIVIREQA
jgi:putative peptidoglycan lipid II flippase